jgi:hypothetical protein
MPWGGLVPLEWACWGRALPVGTALQAVPEHGVLKRDAERLQWHCCGRGVQGLARIAAESGRGWA